MNNIIKAENISKKYRLGEQSSYVTLRDQIASWWNHSKNSKDKDIFWALKDINFNVHEGETLGIIGKNGAGKSTLLRILSRITTPTTGKISMRGRVASLLEVGTGFHHELTGRENIYLNGAVLGMGSKEIRKKFDSIVDFSEIEKFLDTPVKHYSSGMYMRLAFSIAAHLEPEILIVDEVLAVGDSQFQQKCLGKMNEVSKHGRTIIFVSHNLSAIKSLCDRAIILERGLMTYQGDVLTAISKYENRISRKKASVVWKKSQAQLPSAELIEAGVLNNNRPVGAELLSEEPIEIYIRFKVKKEAKIGTTVVLKNQEGETIFTSLSNHELNWHLKTRHKGIYCSTCHIPANFLADGGYLITIGFWEGFYKTGIMEQDVININVHEKGLVRGDLPYEVKDGIVRPLLEWTSNHE